MQNIQSLGTINRSCGGVIVLFKPKYNDTVLSKASKCSGSIESRQGCTLFFSTIAPSADCSLFATVASDGWYSHTLLFTVNVSSLQGVAAVVLSLSVIGCCQCQCVQSGLFEYDTKVNFRFSNLWYNPKVWNLHDSVKI